MSQLVENTYLAYEQFIEGELNQYDLLSLIEEGIISREVLESMLEEGFGEAMHGLATDVSTTIPAAIAAGSASTLLTVGGMGALGAYGAYKLYKYIKNKRKQKILANQNRPYKATIHY